MALLPPRIGGAPPGSHFSSPSDLWTECDSAPPPFCRLYSPTTTLPRVIADGRGFSWEPLSPRSPNATAETTYLYSYVAVRGRLQPTLTVGALFSRCNLGTCRGTLLPVREGSRAHNLLCPGARQVQPWLRHTGSLHTTCPLNPTQTRAHKHLS